MSTTPESNNICLKWETRFSSSCTSSLCLSARRHLKRLWSNPSHLAASFFPSTMFLRLITLGLALLALWPANALAATPGASPQRLKQAQRGKHLQALRQSATWWQALQAAITDIHRHGPGGYSVEDAAHDALRQSFLWNERAKRLVFNPASARPSFCSGAVYAAVLSALIRWDAAQSQRRISPEAWQALAPQRIPDGVGVWGWANANGPGFAMLVHRLGAGVNFTDWAQARPSDIAKFWWNDSIGAGERGHLVILVRDEGDKVRIWSSNQPSGGAADGFGFKTYPKSAIKRVLFTRITNPAAFNRAPVIGEEPWLMELGRRDVTWEECARRCGIRSSGHQVGE